MKRPSSNFAVLSGVCLGAAAWIAPPTLWLGPLAALPLFDRRWPARARLHLAASVLLGLGLALLPRILAHA